MPYILAFIVGYLFGCSHMSYYISKLKNINIKENGSKNYGASNTLILIGKKESLLVLIHDFLKSFLVVKILKIIFPELLYIDIIAGLSAVLGHIFPFYLKFNGGKGFASFIGLIFALDYKIGLITIIMILIVSFVSDKIVIGTFSTITISPILLAFSNNDFKIIPIMYLVSIIIFIKHKDNIKNIINKKEPSLKKALFKNKNKNKKEE